MKKLNLKGKFLVVPRAFLALIADGAIVVIIHVQKLLRQRRCVFNIGRAGQAFGLGYDIGIGKSIGVGTTEHYKHHYHYFFHADLPCKIIKIILVRYLLTTMIGNISFVAYRQERLLFCLGKQQNVYIILRKKTDTPHYIPII